MSTQRGDMQTPYQVSLRSGQDQWQLQQDAHTRILQEMVEGFEARLGEYDMHIQELYRKLVPGKGGSSNGLNERYESVAAHSFSCLVSSSGPEGGASTSLLLQRQCDAAGARCAHKDAKRGLLKGV